MSPRRRAPLAGHHRGRICNNTETSHVHSPYQIKNQKTDVARATDALEQFDQLTKASRPPGTNGSLRKPRVVAPTLRRRRNDPTGTRTPLVSSVIWTLAHTRRKLCPLTPNRETPPHWDPKGSPSAPSGHPTHTYPAKLHPPKSEIRTNPFFSKTQSRPPPHGPSYTLH